MTLKTGATGARRLGVLLLPLLALGCGLSRIGGPDPLRDVRAVWIDSEALLTPERVRAMVRQVDDAGFNTILVQVRPLGDAYYRSALEPRAEALGEADPDYDPLALVLEEAHARGMAVHAWLNTHLVAASVGVHASSSHIARGRPDLLAVPRPLARELYDVEPASPEYRESLLQHARDNSDRVEGLFTSMASPQIMEHLEGVVTDLVSKYDVDGLHFDYVRYPDRAYDYSRVSLVGFRAWLLPQLEDDLRERFDRLEQADPLIYTDSFPDAWDSFRTRQVSGLLERLADGARTARPSVALSAAVFPDAEDARGNRFQEWPVWLREGHVDAVAVMAYTEDGQQFGEWMRAAAEEAGPDPVWAGVGAYLIPARETVAQVQAARDLGLAGVALFSYRSMTEPDSAGVPTSDYLERVARDAFGVRVAGAARNE